MKHSRDQLKENDQNQQQMMQKYQRSQPITPLTILPQIKTPSNRVSQRYTSNNNSSTVNGIKNSTSRVKGKVAHQGSIEQFYDTWVFIVLTSSATDLDAAQQQQKQYQIYQQQNIQKLSTTNNSNNNNNNNINNAMQHSTISNTSSSSSSSLTGGSGKYGMSHSQSTGDVSAIFGRAWHVNGNGSNTLTLSTSKSNSSLKNKEQHQQQQKVLRMDNLI